VLTTNLKFSDIGRTDRETKTNFIGAVFGGGRDGSGGAAGISVIGGSQSERSGSDTQTPLSKGSRSGGADPRKGGQGPRSAFESQGMGQQDVRLAQETLKNHGHDPGPIDGVMGVSDAASAQGISEQERP
jgi:hypothetical protein